MEGSKTKTVKEKNHNCQSIAVRRTNHPQKFDLRIVSRQWRTRLQNDMGCANIVQFMILLLQPDTSSNKSDSVARAAHQRACLGIMELVMGFCKGFSAAMISANVGLNFGSVCQHFLMISATTGSTLSGISSRRC